RGTYPGTRLAGTATTVTLAGSGLAPAGGQLARPGPAAGGSATSDFGTAPAPAGRAGEPSATDTGVATGLVPPGARGGGPVWVGPADDAVPPAQPVTPWESADPVLSPLGWSAMFEVLYGDGGSSSEARGSPVSWSGSGVPSDLSPGMVPLPVELLPHASGGNLGVDARMPGGADSSPTPPADFGARWNPDVFCAALAYVLLGGIHPAEAAEKSEEKRRRLLD